MDLDKTKIIAQTSDMCILQTEELLVMLKVMQNAGWNLIEMIDDDYVEPKRWLRCERYLLCYWKWGWRQQEN